VIGHEIAKGGCGPSRHAYYRRDRSHYASNYRAPAKVYYDERGNPVASSDDPYRR